MNGIVEAEILIARRPLFGLCKERGLNRRSNETCVRGRSGYRVLCRIPICRPSCVPRYLTYTALSSCIFVALWAEARSIEHHLQCMDSGGLFPFSRVGSEWFHVAFLAVTRIAIQSHWIFPSRYLFLIYETTA